MKRRRFIALVGGTAAAWPLAARAQKSATQQRIAIFHPAIPTTLLTETGGGSAWRAFFSELRRLGYDEGDNLIIERYSAEGHHERYADLARYRVCLGMAGVGHTSLTDALYHARPRTSKPSWQLRDVHCPRLVADEQIGR
jgi:hypothetical protein